MRFVPVLFFFVVLFNSCSINNFSIDNDLKQYFDKYKATGSFALFDNAQAQFTIFDSANFRKRYTPASTFKIVNSLIGLETGKIFDEKMVIKWDGVERERTELNKDMTMEEAFKVSSVPYYQEVARRIGKDTMQFWIDTLQYGNKNIGSAVDSFWLNNTIKISPDEQLGLVKRLYFEQLPFQKRTQQIVRKVMMQEDNSLYKLAYKTGWGFDEKGENIGWIVGWIEENRHPYFFVLLVQSPEKNYNMRNNRLALLKDILKHYDFMQGKK
ncbi:class D beta-lactamase [Lacibacter sediminis]|uniref:Beta-lactamase n=1 Tax=Lacibacter sediminis TaxID=2760713 RepID=A0A7G5XEI9_9BACT|nr:class D beta-lactamase [Lacibacter sediminis]QNA43892.1 class D beta-lactamase [Lacibacter sediminis]